MREVLRLSGPARAHTSENRTATDMQFSEPVRYNKHTHF